MISEFIIFNRERDIERKDREEREAAWEKELLQVCHTYFSIFLSSAQCAVVSGVLPAALARRLAEFAFVLHCKSAICKAERGSCLPGSAFFHLRFATTRAGRKLSIVLPRTSIHASFASASQVSQERFRLLNKGNCRVTISLSRA